MKECAINRERMIVSDSQSSKATNPGEGSFNFVSSSVSLTCDLLEDLLVLPVLAVGGNESDSPFTKTLPERIAVISLVCDESLGTRFGTALSTVVNSDVVQSFFYKRDLSRRGRVDMASKWNTLTVDHHHPLRSLAFLGFPDCKAPFFAGAKLPSIKASFQSSFCLSSSSARNARHMSSHRSCSSQRSKRLLHVLPLGKGSGISLQRAPVRKIQRIPSSTSLLSICGRPFLKNRSCFGSNGSIFDHSSSVNIGLGCLIGSPPTSLIREINKKYQYLFDNRAISTTWNYETTSSVLRESVLVVDHAALLTSS
jgi:hypothetical protein